MVDDPTALYALCAKVQEGRYKPIREHLSSLPQTEHRAEFPAELEAVIDRMLATNPERRFRSMRDLGVALLAWADEDTRGRYASEFGVSAGSLAPRAPVEPRVRVDDADTLLDPPVPPRPTTLNSSIRVMDAEVTVPSGRRRKLGVVAAVLTFVSLLGFGAWWGTRPGTPAPRVATQRGIAPNPTSVPVTTVAAANVVERQAPPETVSVPVAPALVISTPVAVPRPARGPRARSPSVPTERPIATAPWVPVPQTTSSVTGGIASPVATERPSTEAPGRPRRQIY